MCGPPVGVVAAGHFAAVRCTFDTVCTSLGLQANRLTPKGTASQPTDDRRFILITSSRASIRTTTRHQTAHATRIRRLGTTTTHTSRALRHCGARLGASRIVTIRPAIAVVVDLVRALVPGLTFQRLRSAGAAVGLGCRSRPTTRITPTTARRTAIAAGFAGSAFRLGFTERHFEYDAHAGLSELLVTCPNHAAVLAQDLEARLMNSGPDAADEHRLVEPARTLAVRSLNGGTKLTQQRYVGDSFARLWDVAGGRRCGPIVQASLSRRISACLSSQQHRDGRSTRRCVIGQLPAKAIHQVATGHWRGLI